MAIGRNSNLGLSHAAGRNHLETNPSEAAFIGAALGSRCSRPGVSCFGVVAGSSVREVFVSGMHETILDAGRAIKSTGKRVHVRGALTAFHNVLTEV
jgi:hypothetical protein